MRIVWMAKTVLSLVLLLMLAACASTIGTKIDIEDARFEIGTTTKNDVADTLGLPNAIEKNQATDREFWAYNDSPQLTGLILPVVSSYGGTLSGSTVELPYFSSGQADKAALICVFDGKGVLVEVQKLR